MQIKMIMPQKLLNQYFFQHKLERKYCSWRSLISSNLPFLLSKKCVFWLARKTLHSLFTRIHCIGSALATRIAEPQYSPTSFFEDYKSFVVNCDTINPDSSGKSVDNINTFLKKKVISRPVVGQYIRSLENLLC